MKSPTNRQAHFHFIGQKIDLRGVNLFTALTLTA